MKAIDCLNFWKTKRAVLDKLHDPAFSLQHRVCLSHRRQSWGIGRSRLPRFWAGRSWGPSGRRESWTGLGKDYSLFCTESTLESVFFIRKREKWAQNVGAKGENVNI